MTIDGLPAHVLLVHAVVVLLPLSALLVVLVAVWPAAADRLGLITAVLAVAVAILVPITTEAGEWLERRVPRTPLLRVHTHLGDTVLPWAVGLAVVAIALYLRRALSGRIQKGTAGAAPAKPWFGGKATTVVAAMIAVIVSFGSAFVIYQVGESGSRAAWTDRFSPTPLKHAADAAPAGSHPTGTP